MRDAIANDYAWGFHCCDLDLILFVGRGLQPF
jgi:hypothetical protein